VGVGTASPSQSLEVAGNIFVNTSGNPNLTVKTSGAGNNPTIRIQADTNYWDLQTLFSNSTDDLDFQYNGTSTMKIDNAGHITKPLQSAFMANLSGSMTNLAINQTTVISFDTERFDQNADFANYTFTAPVTGRYQLSYQLTMNNLDTGTTYYQALLTTSNKAYYNIISTNGFDADQSYFTLTASHLVDMDANDTAYVGMNMPNSGAAQLNITDQSYFSGYLVA
jgi:hypothetical protein